VLQIRDGLPDFLFLFAEALLEASQQFVFLALREDEIVVRKLAVFLFQFAFDFVPISFDFKFSHTKVSDFHGTVAVSKKPWWN
jgi:hypothetical protein